MSALNPHMPKPHLTPSNTTSFQTAMAHLRTLPPSTQNQAIEFIEFLYQKNAQTLPVAQTGKKKRQAGSLAGKIKLAEDFDEALADFNDYM